MKFRKEKNKAIPTISVPSIREYEINSSDEQLVSLRDKGLIVKSQYNKQGIPGSYPDCYARETVADMLVKAQHSLEWWHYDYGDKFWAYFTKNEAIYDGVIDVDFPNRFPLR